MSLYNVTKLFVSYLTYFNLYNINLSKVSEIVMKGANNINNVSIIRDKKIMNDYYNSSYAQDPFPNVCSINGFYGNLFLLLEEIKPEEYFNEYAPKKQRNEAYLNSLIKLNNFRGFRLILFNLLQSCLYCDESTYIFVNIIEHFLKYNKIDNLINDDYKNELNNRLLTRKGIDLSYLDKEQNDDLNNLIIELSKLR